MDPTNEDPKNKDGATQEPAQAAQGGAGGATGGDPAQEPGKGQSATQGAAEGQEGGDGKAGATVNRHKYERELAAKDKEIEGLRAQIAESAKTEEGRKELQKQVDDLKADMADKETTYRLELAGCKNAKAAKALLGDYDGDVDKLKAECPYLFEDKQKKTGATGGKPAGTASDLDAKLDKAFGLK